MSLFENILEAAVSLPRNRLVHTIYTSTHTAHMCGHTHAGPDVIFHTQFHVNFEPLEPMPGKEPLHQPWSERELVWAQGSPAFDLHCDLKLVCAGYIRKGRGELGREERE